MKLNADTLTVLKNFAAINGNILIKKGDTLQTISDEKTVLAKATVSNTFPNDFAIYDLNRLLGTISLFEDSEIEFFDKYLAIKQEKTSVKYFYTEESLISKGPKNEVKLPADGLIKLKLTNADFQKISKAMKVLGLPEVAIIGSDGDIYVAAVDSKESTNDEYKIKVGSTDKSFHFVFKWKNLQKLLEANYEVEISPKGLARFEITESKPSITYFVAVESK